VSGPFLERACSISREKKAKRATKIIDHERKKGIFVLSKVIWGIGVLVMPSCRHHQSRDIMQEAHWRHPI
jgi:hypothetical protein